MDDQRNDFNTKNKPEPTEPTSAVKMDINLPKKDEPLTQGQGISPPLSGSQSTLSEEKTPANEFKPTTPTLSIDNNKDENITSPKKVGVAVPAVPGLAENENKEEPKPKLVLETKIEEPEKSTTISNDSMGMSSSDEFNFDPNAVKKVEEVQKEANSGIEVPEEDIEVKSDLSLESNDKAGGVGIAEEAPPTEVKKPTVATPDLSSLTAPAAEEGVEKSGTGEAKQEDGSSSPPPTTTPPLESNIAMASPRRRKIPLIPLLIGLIVLLGVGFLVKNFLGKAKKEEGITLNYWGLWEPEPVVQGIIAEWEEKNPGIKIKYVSQDKEDYRARLESSLSRGTGPDIFRFHNTWVPILKDELAPVPGSLVSSLGLETNYFPPISDSLSEQSEYYGVPLMIDSLALYYNKDILTAANKSPPRTWWGLENLAKELTVRPDQKITVAGVALGAVNNVDHWSDIVGLMIYQNGGNPAKPDSLVEDVLKYYLRFKNTNRVWDETLPASTLAFANGKLAFYFGPSWRVFNLLDANPNLNFAVTGVPQLPKLKETDWEAAERGEGELTEIGWSTFWSEGVSLKSKYQKEAWKFLEFLGSKETLQKMYTAQSQIRLFGEIYPRTDLASSLETDAIIKPFVDQSKIGKSWFLSSFTHDASGINDRVIKYYEDAINGIDQGNQEKQVIETLSSGINQILTQYTITP